MDSQTNPSINTLGQTLSVFITYALTIALCYIWTVAYLNNGSVTLYINRYGEMQPELVMWVIVLPAITYGYYHLLTAK